MDHEELEGKYVTWVPEGDHPPGFKTISPSGSINLILGPPNETGKREFVLSREYGHDCGTSFERLTGTYGIKDERLCLNVEIKYEGPSVQVPNSEPEPYKEAIEVDVEVEKGMVILSFSMFGIPVKLNKSKG